MSEQVATHDTRLVPAAVAAWGAMAVATWGHPALTAGVALAALTAGLVAGWRRRWGIVAVTAVVVACLVSGGAQTWLNRAHPLAHAAHDRATVEVAARVSGEPRLVPARGHDPALRVIPVTVERTMSRGESWDGRVEAVVLAPEGPAWDAPIVGSRLTFIARAAPTEPGERAVALLKPQGPPRTHVRAGLVWRGIEGVRAGLRRACAPLWPEARGLVPALVVGDVSGLPEAIVADFRVTGLTHLTAVSGPNNNPCMGHRKTL